MQINTEKKPHLTWLKTNVPQGTFIGTTYHIPTTAPIPRHPTPQHVLHMIHDIHNQLVYHSSHPEQPTAPAYFTPDDIIHINNTTAPYFMISPEQFLPATQQTIFLTVLPPIRTPYTPPEITKIPAKIPIQTAYYSLGQLAQTKWPWNTTTVEIDEKMRKFIARACASDPAQRQLLWEENS